ncbi:MAG TPA: non-homologous end-joining DNA ligase [Myxococcota bacterium]|nr:non-homologous end-joining DNA ligase [Myxococcota bacterium]
MGIRRYGRYTVETSHEDKVLFPDVGLTKGALVDYYDAVAETMLPHLRARPLVLQRFPDGITASGFYQKQAGAHFPDWIETTRVTKAEGGHQDLVVGANRATLVYLADQATITLHPWLSRCDRPDHPDRLVFDLDPPGDDFGAVRFAAGRVRELLEDLGLPTFAMLTGSRGMHVVVPLDRSEPFDDVRAFARAVAERLATRHPQMLTTEQRKAKRRGRLYLDVGRNARAQTAVAAYAVRARPGAPVAAPIHWDELGERRLDARRWTVRNVLRRLGQRDDPWKGIARRARSLAPARRRLRDL